MSSSFRVKDFISEINTLDMKAIIALGNPGDKYAKSRHNVGWMIIDEFAKTFGAGEFKESKKLKALVSEITDPSISEEKILLVKPLTFMNLSGESVASLKSFYKLENKDITIVYDDIDLPLGELRFRDSGGPGTHNGMRSITPIIGEDFKRLRFGIENRPDELKAKINLSDYVLNGFGKTEEATVKKQITEAVKMLSEHMK